MTIWDIAWFYGPATTKLRPRSFGEGKAASLKGVYFGEGWKAAYARRLLERWMFASWSAA